MLKADLEAGVPFLGARFGLVVVTNFLLRAIFPGLIDALGKGGYLIYETFTSHHVRFRPPRDRSHLARPGELRERVSADLDIVAYEEVVERDPHRAGVARLAAIRP